MIRGTGIGVADTDPHCCKVRILFRYLGLDPVGQINKLNFEYGRSLNITINFKDQFCF